MVNKKLRELDSIADELFSRKKYSSAANRSYYAIYLRMDHYLDKNEIDKEVYKGSSHNKVSNAFFNSYLNSLEVKKAREFMLNYRNLKGLREKADYTYVLLNREDGIDAEKLYNDLKNCIIY